MLQKMVLTRQEFLDNPNKWFDECPELVKELKKFCYEEIMYHSDFYRLWFKEYGEIGLQKDRHYLELNKKVLRQKWKMQ